jgi:23S rRNA (uracil1939-C5)-methyltransferase
VPLSAFHLRSPIGCQGLDSKRKPATHFQAGVVFRTQSASVAALELPESNAIAGTDSTRIRLGLFQTRFPSVLGSPAVPNQFAADQQSDKEFVGRGKRGDFKPGLREIEFFADAKDESLLVEVYCTRDVKMDAAEKLGLPLQAAVPQSLGVAVFHEPTGKDESMFDSAPLVRIRTCEMSYQTAGATYRVSAGSFFQTNRHLTDELVGIVTQGRSGRTALDLYAGVGLFSVVLSREFERVIAVESSLHSHTDLTYNVPANVRAVRATVDQYLRNASDLRADLVVVDPPRGGLGERVTKSLIGLKVPNVVYVSCDPATLARDLVALLAAGYHVEQAHLVDLFPQTFHVESVFSLAR